MEDADKIREALEQYFPHIDNPLDNLKYTIDSCQRALPLALKYIDSFDSTAYTFPRGRGRGSCKNQQERVEFFRAYLNRIKEIESQHDYSNQTTLGDFGFGPNRAMS